MTAYAGGRLTIDIANGGTINGLVDAGTELRCESEQEAEHGWSRAARRSLRAGAATDDENQDPVVDDGDPGDDGTDGHGQPDGHHGHEGGSARPLSRLKAGTRVHEAELETGPNGARFASIELLR